MEDAMEADQTPATAEPAAGAVIVYRCGLRAPLDWGRDCDDQLYLMTRLWNTLVEIEHAHREAYFAATASDPVVAAIEAEITGLERLLEQLYAQRAELRKAARKRVRTPELDERIAELKAKLKARRAEAKEARKAARETIKPQLETLEAERREAVKVARNASGLWWGNYNAVCADYDRARSAVIKRGGKLQFRRHDGSGRLVNQIQGGMSVADLLGRAHSQVQVTGGAWAVNARGHLTATVYTRTAAAARAAGAGGTRRTVTWPLQLRRPRPGPYAQARIKEVVITRRRRGHKFDWHVSFLCQQPAAEPALPAGRACGIDVGWRRLNDGVRVGTIVYSSGEREFVVLPERLVAAARRAQDIASRRDKIFNDLIVSWRAIDWTSAPEELAATAVRLQKSKLSPPQLHGLVYAWRRHPFFAPDAFTVADRWLAEDKKLWETEASLARHVSNARRDLYRGAAKRLVATCGLIGIEDIDLAALARRKTPAGGDNEIAQATAWWRRIAAPGELLAAISHAARRDGALIHKHSGKSTWICAQCGTESMPSDRSQLVHTCPHCSHTWDQDVNAARNLLAAALASAPVTLDGPAALAWEKPRDPNDLEE